VSAPQKTPAIAWDQIDTVMLDMDGTLLDLAFDNWFWQTHVPETWAEKHGLGFDEAFAQLQPRFREVEGTLDWYCLEYWTRNLELDIIAMKDVARERIGLRQGVIEFLQALNASGRRPWLVTNAHGAILDIKMQETAIDEHFAHLITTHDFGYPKEMPEFWDALMATHPFDPARTILIDDSFPVLQSARDWGIGHTIGILEPDSSNPARESDEFVLLDNYADHQPEQRTRVENGSMTIK